MKLLVFSLYVHSSQLHPTWCILGSTDMPVISIQTVYSTFCEAYSPHSLSLSHARHKISTILDVHFVIKASNIKLGLETSFRTPPHSCMKGGIVPATSTAHDTEVHADPCVSRVIDLREVSALIQPAPVYLTIL